MTGAMYEMQLANDRRQELLAGASEYRLAKLARGGMRRGRRGRRTPA